MNYSATLENIRSMSIDERIELIETVWDEIANEQTEHKLTEAQEQELDRRLASHEAAPDNVVPWEQVKAEAEARLQK